MSPQGRKLWFQAATIIILLVGTWFTQWAVLEARRESREEYMLRAKLVAQTLDPLRVGSLAGSEADLANPEYLQLKRQLADLMSVYTDCSFLYLMGQNASGQVFFLVDNEPAGSEDESAPGSLFPDASPELKLAFARSEPLCEGPVADDWGTWISALVPLTRPTDGRLVAMVGMDFDAGGFTARTLRAGLIPALLSALLLVTLWLGYLLLVRRHAEKRQARNFRLEPETLLVIALGLIITCAGSWTAQKVADRQSRKALVHLTQLETNHVLNAFQVLKDISLPGLESFILNSTYLEKEEFNGYSRHILESGLVKGLGWLPVDKVRSQEADSSRALFVPESGELDILELAVDPAVQSALQEAESTRLPALADLSSGPGEPGTLAVLSPVQTHSDPDRLLGFTILLITPQQLLHQVEGNCRELNHDELLHVYLTLLGRGNEMVAVLEDPGLVRPVLAFGRAFAAYTRPGPEFLASHRSNAAQWDLLAGLLFTLALAVNTSLVTRHQAKLESRVREQTATLRQSEARFRDIAESMADWIWEIDPQGRYTYCSTQVTQVLGYEPEEILGKTPFDIMDPDEAERVGREVLPLMEQLAPIRNLENWNLTQDGRRVCLQTSGVPVFNEDGTLRGYRGVDTDITERKWAEETLLSVNRELEATSQDARQKAQEAEAANAAKSDFLANMSHEIRTPMNGVIGMTTLLLDTALNDQQRRYAEAVQSSAESLLGLINDILDFSKIEAGKLEFEQLEFDLQEMMEGFAEMMAFKAFGKGLDFVCSVKPGTPTRFRGDPNRLRQILINLTGNAIKFTDKGEVEIRAQLAEAGPDSSLIRFSVRDSGIGIPPDQLDKLFQKFTQLDSSTTRQYGGTGLGLAISRQLAEAMGGKIGAISCEGCGTEFWFTVRLDNQQQVPARVDLAPAELKGLPLLLVGTHHTSRQALREQLVDLGIVVDAVAETRVAVTKLRQAIALNNPFGMVVVDRPIGLCEDGGMCAELLNRPELAQIPVVLLVAANQPDRCSSCLRDNRAHVLGKPYRRQDLIQTLQTALTGQPPSAQQAVSALNEEKIIGGSQARILLVEDNLVNQKVALGLLKKQGLTADLAANGEEALAALARQPYDLVLMDCQMPIMDGYEATRKIRDTESDVLDHAVPVIALTANAMKGDQEKCFLAGMDDYLAKPLNPQALATLIEKWLPVNSPDST